MKTAREIFESLGGKFYQPTLNNLFPVINASVFRTAKGVPYLKEPGIAMLTKPQTCPQVLEGFLSGFDPNLEFNDYLQDPDGLTDGEWLAKIAGQLCYLSFGPKRTKNADAKKYFDNIKSSGHGSVLEHPNFSFLIYGNTRSETHEQVRHRSGFGYSQVSQRYVDGPKLRFVERPEFQALPALHDSFVDWIDRSWDKYHETAEFLYQQQVSGEKILTADAKTDLRKKVQQAARAHLPNETEAPILTTGNIRAWRHFIEMRANEHAEIEIREVAFRIFLCLTQVEQVLLDDYEILELADGTHAVRTKYRKV